MKITQISAVISLKNKEYETEEAYINPQYIMHALPCLNEVFLVGATNGITLTDESFAEVIAWMEANC